MIRYLECLCSCSCLIAHLFSVFATKDPYPHDVIFCGTFTSFILVSILAITHQSTGSFNYYIEGATALIGFVLFIFSSIWTMVLVEMDEHLPWLSEKQEYDHPFFINNRVQSVGALITAFIFLLHFIFTIDYLINKSESRKTEGDNDSTTSLYYQNISVDLELYFFPQHMWNGIVKAGKKMKLKFCK
ncbi:unnamed protein product [Chironomus riparius]|uniref:DUF7775 domain-containing protein n=1 Tax=Chironomus riparius TaxID=315576 RepID=A0A9N9RNB1_9DIPT|nr:unnamed protein product [Chironomus riparius]